MRYIGVTYSVYYDEFDNTETYHSAIEVEANSFEEALNKILEVAKQNRENFYSTHSNPERYDLEAIVSEDGKIYAPTKGKKVVRRKKATCSKCQSRNTRCYIDFDEYTLVCSCGYVEKRQVIMGGDCPFCTEPDIMHLETRLD